MKIPAVRLLVLSSALAISLPGVGQIITNGGFETGDFTGWTAVGNDVAVEAAGWEGYPAHTGNYFAGFGTAGMDGTLSQTITDTAGESLTLSYYLASNGVTPNDFNTYIDGSNVFSETDIPTQGYTLYSFTFTGTGSDVIEFGGRDDNNYLALDDVSVTPAAVVGATPEPASLALLGTGLLGVVGVARRRFLRA